MPLLACQQPPAQAVSVPAKSHKRTACHAKQRYKSRCNAVHPFTLDQQQAATRAVVANSQPQALISHTLTVRVLDSPPTVRLPALVKHLLAKDAVLLSEAISDALQLPQDFVLDLIRFGAVHWCPVPPPLPDTGSFLQLGEVSHAFLAREAALAVFGKYPAHQTPRRAAEDVPVSKDSYIRVHVHPRRCPAFYTCDWQSRVVYDCEEYVVISKPPGVPVAPTVDNMLECTLTGAKQAIGFEGPLLITHRLDRCTEGLVVIGKTRDFVRRFNLLIQGKKGDVHKFYRTFTLAPPTLGPMVHHVTLNAKEQGMPPHTRVHPMPVPGSLRCELEVLAVEPIPRSQLPAALQPELVGDAGAWESTLVLRTGRTHQIRAQYAAAGCPIFGDALYAGAPLGGRLNNVQDEHLKDTRAKQEPKSAIGLQACRIEIEPRSPKDADLKKTFEAGSPWWRGGVLPPALALNWSVPVVSDHGNDQ